MKQELQKLQQESKMGQKSKDVTAKDLEATKKKLQDVEAKLKVAVSDKQAALQVRSPQALRLVMVAAACSTAPLAGVCTLSPCGARVCVGVCANAALISWAVAKGWRC